MSKRRMPGLTKRGEIWHIDKQVRGYGRVCESCETRDLREAERYLIHRLEEIREALVYGVRPTRTFEQAAKKYLEENTHKRSLDRDVYALQAVMSYIGALPLERVHDDALAQFKRDRHKDGRKAGTINKELSVVRRILNLAARVWRHPDGMTWLATPPLLQMVKGPERKPWPISWDEQGRLFQELPPHLERMALFAVNTGLRSGEICRLRWDWEVLVPEIGSSVFLIPDEVAKNGQERVVVLNRIARSVVEAERNKHPRNVFTYKGQAIQRINSHAYRRARERVGLQDVRVHDLRHTFGHRLRAAGVSFEDRQDLLGHKSGRITTHYSAPDLRRLVDAVETLVERRQATVLRVASGHALVDSRKTPAKALPQKTVIEREPC